MKQPDGACYYCGHEPSPARGWKIGTGVRHVCDFCQDARSAAAAMAMGEPVKGKGKSN